MLQKTISIIFLLVCTHLIAQEKIDESKYFIHTYDGEIIYTKYIDYKTPLFKRNYFKINGEKIEERVVKFYRAENGFFGNIKDFGGGFAERIIKGKINLFEHINTYTTNVPNANGFGSPMMTTNTVVNRYYNSGYNSLKVADYENLSVELASNSKSIEILNDFHTAKKKRVMWYVIGGVATVVGILTAGKKTGEYERTFNHNTGWYENTPVTEIRPVNLTIGLLGFATVVGTYISSLKKKDHIKKAIMIYNDGY